MELSPLRTPGSVPSTPVPDKAGTETATGERVFIWAQHIHRKDELKPESLAQSLENSSHALLSYRSHLRPSLSSLKVSLDPTQPSPTCMNETTTFEIRDSRAPLCTKLSCLINMQIPGLYTTGYSNGGDKPTGQVEAPLPPLHLDPHPPSFPSTRPHGTWRNTFHPQVRQPVATAVTAHSARARH